MQGFTSSLDCFKPCQSWLPKGAKGQTWNLKQRWTETSVKVTFAHADANLRRSQPDTAGGARSSVISDKWADLSNESKTLATARPADRLCPRRYILFVNARCTTAFPKSKRPTLAV